MTPPPMAPTEAAAGLEFLAEDDRSILSPAAQRAMRARLDHARTSPPVTRAALVAAARAEGVAELAERVLTLLDEDGSIDDLTDEKCSEARDELVALARAVKDGAR